MPDLHQKNTHENLGKEDTDFDLEKVNTHQK